MSGNEEFVQEFLVECAENLDQLDQDLVALEEHPGDPQRLASIFRTMHTIKGTSGFFGFAKLGALAHAGENLLGRLREGHIVLTADIATALLELVDTVRQFLVAIERTGSEGEGDFASLSARLILLAEPSLSAVETSPKALRNATSAHAPVTPAMARPATMPATVSGSPSVVATPAPSPSPVVEAGASSAAEQSAKQVIAESATPDDIARADAAAEWTGAAARDETQLSPAEQQAVQPEELNVSDAESPAPVSQGSVRVDVGLLNQLMNQVGELVLARNQIRPFAEAVQDRVFAQATQQLDHITSELQEGIMKTRMQPIGNLWSRLPRVVRDLARAREKLVQLEMHGRETELDRTLIEAIKDPLTHLVRNAVDHGIETPAVRVERGKPETGQIVLRAYHEGGLVNIEISDDGAGIDSERVREKALRMGLISRDQARAMTDHQVKQWIFSPGLSTAERVTDISGRGVGLDVVKTNIERIGGSVTIDSRVGHGTTFRVKIPLTLAIIPALIVVTRGERFAIPQVSLREIISFQEGASRVVEAIGAAQVYRLRGELLPLVDLREVLQLPPLSESDRNTANIMVLQAVGQRFGLVVDRVRNTEEIVVKPLHKTLARLSVFSGATIMGDGRVALILDVVGLARIAGVVDLGQDAVGQTAIEAEETEEVESNGFGDYLVCDVARDRQVAVLLSDVARLEEIPAAAIQNSTGQPVVPYRNHIMPLLHVDRTGDVTASAQGTVPVVVHSVGRRYVGLMVNRIVDIATADQELDVSQRQTEIRGRTLIRGHVMDIVDIRELARACGISFVSEPAVGANR